MNVKYFCHNATAITDEDYMHYLDCMREYASQHSVHVRVATRQKFHDITGS